MKWLKVAVVAAFAVALLIHYWRAIVFAAFLAAVLVYSEWHKIVG
jgi:hypothetical protein